MARPNNRLLHQWHTQQDILEEAVSLGFTGDQFDFDQIDKFLKSLGLCLQKGYQISDISKDLYAICLWGISRETVMEIAVEFGYQGLIFDQELISTHLKNNHNFFLVHDQTSDTYFTNAWLCS